MDYRKFFKGKKITIMGLGLLGRGVGDAAFLAGCGTELIVTDIKAEKELAPSLAKLKQFKNITFHLGGHRLEDFFAKDGQAPPGFILKAAGVPLDSPFIAEARKNKIPIEMDASLFAKLAPKTVKIIGVTGTRGKTTTTMMIYEIIERALGKKVLGAMRSKVYLAGNIKDTATLPLLKEVKDGDYVVMELDSWQLQGFGEAKISPNVAVFTTFYPDHMNYYSGSMERYFTDKANIFKYQKSGDALVMGEGIPKAARQFGEIPIPKTAAIARAADLPRDWRLKIPGEHNRANAASARAAARALEIPDPIIRGAIENFGGVPGRLELVREINGVKIYNDTTSTTPEATIAGLKALGGMALGTKNVVLILGGDDKNLDMSGLIAEIAKRCSKVILFKERGTERIKGDIFKLKEDGVEVFEEEGLEATVKRAFSIARPGDAVLYSPAFASFGKWFKNEYDRGEQFDEVVKGL